MGINIYFSDKEKIELELIIATYCQEHTKDYSKEQKKVFKKLNKKVYYAIGRHRIGKVGNFL